MATKLACALVLICGLHLAAVGLAIPKSEDLKHRVQEKTLSDKDHYEDEEGHNLDYDHEAFLGEQEARTFDELPPEESRARLGIIVGKMDVDSDGFVSLEELKNWIQSTQKRYVQEDLQKQWNAHNPSDITKLTWEEYRKSTYGFVDDSPENDVVEDDGYSYREMMKRDQRRWNAADKDSDGTLTLEEFSDFLHPEDAPHMREVVVQETMDDIDRDKDGKVSIEEYIGDMYHGNTGEVEPEWVQTEREQFGQYRDKDGDGYMNGEEVRAWIYPIDYNHADAEAKHLLYESDKDQDKKLSKEEILNNYDLFVGSQATYFGEALARHDEF